VRSLPVLLPAAVIRARACPLASIRQVRTWRLRFVEHTDGAERLPRPAGWSDVVEAHAVPRDGRVVELAGDGFRAVWDAPQPVDGRVRLHGELIVDPLDGLETTGRIHRVRLLTETVREGPAGERAVALTARDLSAVPKTVDDSRDRGVLLDMEIGAELGVA
jgi:hypothetical protein